jgi:transcriptional regulator with XRE-family HTH domain
MTEQQPTNSLQRFLDGDLDAQPRGIEDSANDVGSRMAEARAAAGRTQAEIANQLGVKASTVAKWEHGSASPRSNRLAALAGIVGHGDEPTSSDDLDEIKVALNRIQAQLVDTLNEVDVLAARIDIARVAD